MFVFKLFMSQKKSISNFEYSTAIIKEYAHSANLGPGNKYKIHKKTF